MLCSDVEKIIESHMLLDDKGIVKLLCAYIISLRMPISPPWLFIIGPSSGGKSMLLKCLSKVSGYSPLDEFSVSTMLSGAKSSTVQTSYLKTLPNDAFMVFKDFTTYLSKNKEQLGAIVGILRKVYDGDMSKRTGLGEKLDWEGKVGVLGGATSTFHTSMRHFSDMGERIILYQFSQPDNVELGWYVLDEEKSEDDKANEEDMRTAFEEYLDNSGFEAFTILPKLTNEIKADLIDLADMTTRARSAVERDQYSQDKRIIAVHFREQIARFLKEMKAIAYGLIRINEHDGLGVALTNQDKAILYRLALDSIPMNRRLILEALTRFGTMTTERLSIQIGFDEKTIRFEVLDLVAHGMIEDIKTSTHTHSYRLKDRWSNLFMKFKGIKFETLPEPKPIPSEYIPTPEEAGFGAIGF
jgi:hypothetical protein